MDNSVVFDDVSVWLDMDLLCDIASRNDVNVPEIELLSTAGYLHVAWNPISNFKNIFGTKILFAPWMTLAAARARGDDAREAQRALVRSLLYRIVFFNSSRCVSGLFLCPPYFSLALFALLFTVAMPVWLAVFVGVLAVAILWLQICRIDRKKEALLVADKGWDSVFQVQ